MKGLIVADWRTTKADRIRSAHAKLVAARAEYDATVAGCDAELDPGGIRDPLATYVVAWNQYVATLEAIRNEHVI